MPATLLGPLPIAPAATPLLLYREVSCGFPSPAEPYAEKRLSLDELVQVRQPSMFLVRAMGDSMVGVGIHEGDILVVDRAREARSGDVVVACLANVYQFTVKRLRIEQGRVMLEPANPEYTPIVVDGEDELLIWGVCTWNLHRLTP